MSECIIGFVDISDISHTGENLANMLSDTMENSGLQNKVFAIVADNATNNDSLFLNLRHYSTIEQVQCFGHILNLVVQDALEQISESISSLWELLKKIRNSSQKLEMLEKLCSSCDISPVKPIPYFVIFCSQNWLQKNK